MLDFLKFWKGKEPALDEPTITPPEKPPGMSDLDTGPMGPEPELPGMPGEEFAKPTSAMAPEQPSAFQKIEPPTPPGAQSAGDTNKDFQLINAKLDAIKAGIDHLNARLDKLETKEEKEIVAWR
jgi:hypothetical protein